VIELDHVLIAVNDLENGALTFEYEHGVVSYEGGRHPDWGTANRIVPLGDAYVELVAAVDHEKALTSQFGRWVLAAEDGQPLGWAVRGDIDEISHRLDLPVGAGSRRTVDGSILRWRHAGFDQVIAEPCLPFFIQWEPGAPFPGDGGTARLTRLELQGDPERIAGWLGEHELPIAVTPGAPAVVGFELG